MFRQLCSGCFSFSADDRSDSHRIPTTNSQNTCRAERRSSELKDKHRGSRSTKKAVLGLIGELEGTRPNSAILLTINGDNSLLPARARMLRSGEVFAVFHPTLHKSLNFVLPLLVLALIAENLILLRQNHSLKTELPLPSALAVHREEPLHDIGGVGFDGRFHAVEMPRSAAEHLLVFTFAPRCPECVLSQSFDAALSAQAKKLGWLIPPSLLPVWFSRIGFCSGGRTPGRRYLAD